MHFRFHMIVLLLKVKEAYKVLYNKSIEGPLGTIAQFFHFVAEEKNKKKKKKKKRRQKNKGIL